MLNLPKRKLKEQKFKDGSLQPADGAVYEGGFKNGVRSGEGTLTFPDGTVYKGVWKKDKLQTKNVEIEFFDNSVKYTYKGQ